MIASNDVVDRLVLGLAKLNFKEEVILNDPGGAVGEEPDEYSVKIFSSGVGIYVELANPVGEGMDVWKPFYMLFQQEDDDDYSFLNEGTWDCDEAVRELVKLHVGTLI